MKDKTSHPMVFSLTVEHMPIVFHFSAFQFVLFIQMSLEFEISFSPSSSLQPVTRFSHGLSASVAS